MNLWVNRRGASGAGGEARGPSGQSGWERPDSACRASARWRSPRPPHASCVSRHQGVAASQPVSPGRAILLGRALAATVCAATPQRPNIMSILADDLGRGDLSCYGNISPPTSHFDRLAAPGKLCTNFHGAGSVCAPRRGSFFTSQYPARQRIHGHFATPELNAARGLSQFREPGGGTSRPRSTVPATPPRTSAKGTSATIPAARRSPTKASTASVWARAPPVPASSRAILTVAPSPSLTFSISRWSFHQGPRGKTVLSAARDAAPRQAQPDARAARALRSLQ